MGRDGESKILFPTMKSLDAGKKEEKKAASLDAVMNQAAEVLTQQLEAMPAAKAEPVDFSKVKIEPLFEDLVDFDTFAKSDFRVVKIEECEAVPKSKKLLKFILNDGTDRKRTILSGIHDYYEPEELVGRKIIVIANLKPARFSGVSSQGMLLAGTNNACGCKVIFVDDAIPAGTRIQ